MEALLEWGEVRKTRFEPRRGVGGCQGPFDFGEALEET